MLQVMILSMFLIAIGISGCSSAQPVVSVPQRCIVPYTPEPVIDNTLCAGNVKCVHDKVLKNYEAMKAYAEELKNNSEVCR